MHATELHPRSVVLCCAVAIIIACSFSAIAEAQDRLLQETVEFTGAITFFEHKVPGLVIGAVRNGERVISGFGTTSTGSNAVPDGKTIFRIGSVTKAFTGAILASTAAEGTVALTDRLQKYLGWDVKVPTRQELAPSIPTWASIFWRRRWPAHWVSNTPNSYASASPSRWGWQTLFFR